MTERNIYLEDVPLEEAQKRLASALRKVGKWDTMTGESVSLMEALGRFTAEPIWAKISSPHYHSAAMDGYAVLAKNTLSATETRPVRLKIGTQAFPVNTGAPLPEETNAVIMIEDVQHPTPDEIEIRAAVAPWKHVRLMGEDMVATELVLPINHKIRPVDLGAVAGCGHFQVSVRRKPRVILIPTGSELIPASQTPQPGEIIEYNSLVLSGQISEVGGIAQVMPIIPDELEEIRAAFMQAIREQPDLILILSGSSAGSRDFTAAVVREQGDLLVHGVAVRPGHPVIIGMVETIPVIGVPGYPVSAALTGEIFVQPLLKHWLGNSIDSPTRIKATVSRKLTSPTGDDDFVRVTLAQVGERLLATPLSRGAGVITSLVRADGLAHIPRFSEGLDMGREVDALLYRPMRLIQNTVLMMGSHDPMLDVLAQALAMHFPGERLVSANVGSLGGLVALRRQEAHLAGSHLLDTQTGEYNIFYVRQHLKDHPLHLITFAHREQGLMVMAGNPHHIHSFDDLTRVRYVNRQRGAGTRILLDAELQKRGILPEQITGYDREEYTHLAAAAAVASGLADCGLGVRNAALALNLDFISVGWERYDLVIPQVYFSHPVIQHVLEILTLSEFQQQIAQHPGYNTSEMGKIQYQQ